MLLFDLQFFFFFCIQVFDTNLIGRTFLDESEFNFYYSSTFWEYMIESERNVYHKSIITLAVVLCDGSYGLPEIKMLFRPLL